jgi:WD40 repeat protein
MGHIKFWRMASTFTGLKLQGYLGKFGSSELSDIVAFIQLPDGKVLSSTEIGTLLLWDGGMIKCELALKGKRGCHQGRIESISQSETEIITAGADGYIRVWDLEMIDNADFSLTSKQSAGEIVSQQNSTLHPNVFELEPIEEIQVGKDVKVSIINQRLNQLFATQQAALII